MTPFRFRMLPFTLLAANGLASPAWAALTPGDAAPAFTVPATLDGQRFTFSLADALGRGPVVLYFYPQAFTAGCSEEAHEFAEAMPRFHQLGATVIGVSGDDIATLDRFSASECGGRFPVAADPNRAVMRRYDAVLIPLLAYASRTSYVITPDRRVFYAYSALSPGEHVANILAALASWRTAHPMTTNTAP